MTAAQDVQAGASFFLDVDADGRILRCEGDTFGLLGLSASGIEGISLYDLVTESDSWLASDALEAVARSGTTHGDRFGFNNFNGESLPCRITLRRVGAEAGMPIMRLYAMQDESDGTSPMGSEDYGDDIKQVLADLESDLREETYDDPTLSIYSLDAEAGDDDDIEEILAAADRMASSVTLAAQGRATSFRVDRQTVSVLHGPDFDAEAVSQKASKAAGEEYDVGRTAIDLADADIDVQEKLDLIEKTITARRLADTKLDSGANLSVQDAREALDAQLSQQRTNQTYALEVAYSTSTGAPVLALLNFDNPLSALAEEPTAEERRLAIDLLNARMEAATAVAHEHQVPACVAMDATMLARLGNAAANAFSTDVLVLATGVGRLTPADGQRFAAVFSHARRTIVEGADLVTSNALQRLISKTNNLEFIRVPSERFGDDPAAQAESFRSIAQLCAKRDVAIYVNGIEDSATALALKEVSQICLGGPAVFPGLFSE